MRFFIALEIPEENKPQLQAIQQKLHTLIPQLKLTAPDKFHITFAFIGEQMTQVEGELVHVLAHAAKDIHPFEITPAYIDGFPDIHHPKVLWAGVKGDIDKIIILRERIKDGLTRLNLDTDERRFVPHISLAKLNHDTEISIPLEEQLQTLFQNGFTPMKITSIKLLQSLEENGFHTHTTLAEIRLI